MTFITRDGVRLAYADTDPGNIDRPSLLLLHGWCHERTSMAAQAAAFRNTHRVVSVDLRGFGESDAPQQEYTMEAYADDVAWLCEQLKLVKPVVVGHSMGGNIALELSLHHPHVPRAIVLLDTIVFPPPELAALVDQMVAAVSGTEYVAMANTILGSISLPSDTATRRQLTDALHAPHHVVLSAFRHHNTPRSGQEAASAWKRPIAYIAAASKPLADLTELQRVAPQLQTARVLGVGHFFPQEDPAQCNAMIARFFRLLNTAMETEGSQ